MEHEYYPGFRFFPVEEELITFYLHNKLQGTRPDIDRVIPLLDIYDHVPSHLPQLAGECCRGETEQWFFFVPMQDREARGGRPNRLTNEGYWKATGSPGYVYSSQNRVIGVKRTMVFYQGRAPNGHKTPWKMNEYRATEPQDPSSNPPKVRQELSLCRVYNGSKSIRAFDRRPPPAAATSSSAAPLHLNPSSLPDHREVITSSSSSGEDAPPPPPPPPQAMDTGDDQNFMDVNFQNVPMWDFEEQFKYW